MSETSVNLNEPEEGTKGDRGGPTADLAKSPSSEASTSDLQG